MKMRVNTEINECGVRGKTLRIVYENESQHTN